eukprot:scaffold1060_cov246-Pinguiococcus_pyrenoidosus.AAC.11
MNLSKDLSEEGVRLLEEQLVHLKMALLQLFSNLHDAGKLLPVDMSSIPKDNMVNAFETARESYQETLACLQGTHENDGANLSKESDGSKNSPRESDLMRDLAASCAIPKGDLAGSFTQHLRAASPPLSEGESKVLITIHNRSSSVESDPFFRDGSFNSMDDLSIDQQSAASASPRFAHHTVSGTRSHSADEALAQSKWPTLAAVRHAASANGKHFGKPCRRSFEETTPQAATTPPPLLSERAQKKSPRARKPAPPPPTREAYHKVSLSSPRVSIRLSQTKVKSLEESGSKSEIAPERASCSYDGVLEHKTAATTPPVVDEDDYTSRRIVRPSVKLRSANPPPAPVTPSQALMSPGPGEDLKKLLSDLSGSDETEKDKTLHKLARTKRPSLEFCPNVKELKTKLQSSIEQQQREGPDRPTSRKSMGTSVAPNGEGDATLTSQAKHPSYKPEMVAEMEKTLAAKDGGMPTRRSTRAGSFRLKPRVAPPEGTKTGCLSIYLSGGTLLVYVWPTPLDAWC